MDFSLRFKLAAQPQNFVIVLYTAYGLPRSNTCLVYHWVHNFLTNELFLQMLIGSNRICYAHEYSTVDPTRRLMEMRSANLTFCNFVSMKEVMSYRPHPDDPENKTLLKQETVVTVRGVPLTSYMEGIILGTVSANAGKGRIAIEWVTKKLDNETKSLSERLESIKLEVADLTHKVEDTLINAAKNSIEEFQRDLLKIQPPMVKAEEARGEISSTESWWWGVTAGSRLKTKFEPIYLTGLTC